MSEPDRKRHHRRAYCLRCFATLPDDTNLCRECHFVSTPSMRGTFWSQVPWMCAVERWVKFGGALLAIPTAAYLAFQVRGSTGGGYIVGLPLFAYAGVGMTIGKLTRHLPHFRPGVFWTSAFAIGAVVFPALGYIGELGSSGWRETLLLSGLCLVCSRAAWRLARRGERWKRRLMDGEPTDG